jgi:membrane-bound serine protease (ClpP class)
VNASIVRSITRICYIFLFIAGFFLACIDKQVEADSSSIEILNVKGTIVPVVADYINRGISHAESVNSAVCIIKLNTPGGLLAATETIVERILNARVPVVVYITPQGAWAASAGTFITLSSHIAVMAPGTTIGAAHPVSGSGEQMPEDVAKKVTEYSAAWIKSIAERKNRNPDEAELAVKESKSFTVDQAIQNKLVDFSANDINDLINKLDGKRVIMANGEERVINTAGKPVSSSEMNWFESFLLNISDPNIAYILLSLASIGLITEISNPGMIFPGVAGGICLFLSLYSLGSLNAYWAGLLLIILAFGLFIAELFTTAFGILTTGGIISLIIGSLILFTNNPQEMTVNPVLIVVVVIAIAAFFIFVIGAVIRGQRRKPETGSEALIGRIAVVKEPLNPKGLVMVEGELWKASINSDSADIGEEVSVSRVDGLKLIVSKIKR